MVFANKGALSYAIVLWVSSHCAPPWFIRSSGTLISHSNVANVVSAFVETCRLRVSIFQVQDF